MRESLERRPELHRVLPNTGWMLADRVVRMIVAIGVGTWVARYLGPGPYGQINFAIAWVALFMPFAALAHERIVVRELVATPERSHSVLGSAAGLRLIGGLLGYVVAVAGMWVLRPGDHQAVTLVAIIAAVMLVQPLGVVELWYQARIRSRDAVLALLSAALAGAALKVTLIFARAALPAFAWATLAEAALTSVLLATVYQNREKALWAWRSATAEARALLRDSWPLVLTGAVILVYMRIDQVMLGQMSSPIELGAYSAAVKLVEAWYFIPTAVVASVFPTIIEVRNRNEALFHDRLERLYGMMAAAAYVIALPTCLLANRIVAILYGRGFEPAGPMLAVLVWSLLFTNLGVARGAFLVSMNWTKLYLMTVAFGGVVNVVLNLVLIPRWGGMGAVIASLVAYWVATHGSCFVHRSLRPTAHRLTRAMLRPRF